MVRNQSVLLNVLFFITSLLPLNVPKDFPSNTQRKENLNIQERVKPTLAGLTALRGHFMCSLADYSNSSQITYHSWILYNSHTYHSFDSSGKVSSVIMPQFMLLSTQIRVVLTEKPQDHFILSFSKDLAIFFPSFFLLVPGETWLLDYLAC